MNVIAAIARADATERTRRFAFLIIIAAALYAGYLYIPGPHAAYSTVSINEHRGLYNARYLGVAMALLTNSFLSLAGFFFVRGSVQRDWELHVEGAVASSGVTRASFILGKWLSNLAVLSAVAALSFVAAMGMQQWHGEDRAFDLMAYVLPYVVLTIPAMAFVSAVATVFDVIPLLRGVIGGVVYVMAIWMTLLIVPMQMQSKDLTAHTWLDPLGVTAVVSDLYVSEHAAFPHEKRHNDVTIGGDPIQDGPLGRFQFDGMHWSPRLLAERALWLALSIALVFCVAPLFDRFRGDRSHDARQRRSVDISAYLPAIPALRTVRAEFVLLVNGTSLWWLLGGVALAILTAVVPLKVDVDFILPLALIWPLERISTLGARERQNAVFDIFAATPGFTWRNVVAQWIAGTLVSTLIAAGFVIRLMAAGNAAGALAVVLMIAATVACALALGSFTGASRGFQALFLVAWYLGPIEHLPGVDIASQAQMHPFATVAVASMLAVAGIIVTVSQRRSALA